jgi:hypothetical protein
MRTAWIVTIGIGVVFAIDVLAALFVQNYIAQFWIYAGVPVVAYSILQSLLFRRVSKKLDNILNIVDRIGKPTSRPLPWRYRLPNSRN